MKILLVYTNRYRYLSSPPVGLTYLVLPLKKADHDVKLLDLMFSKNPHEELKNTIDAFKPALAGFSIRNLDNQSMMELKSPLEEIREFVSIVKDNGIKTILGGTAFSTMPENMLKFMNADFGIKGQGEEALSLLADALECNKPVLGIPGLVYRDNGRVIVNPVSITGYNDKKPDWSLVNMKKYKNNSILTPCATVVVKTGCPYECNFCDTGVTMGNKFLFNDIDRIIDDIKSLKKLHDVRWFFLNGICFNSPIDFAKRLLHRIIRENLKIRFMCRLYPIRGSYDTEFFELYKKAGGYFTMMDLSSFSDRMLASYNKPFDTQDIYDFGRIANKHGLKFGVELLFGGPGETHKTLRESMDFLPKLEYSLLLYNIGIRINPGTEIFDIALKEGQLKNPEELLFSKFYISKDIDINQAKEYIDKSLKKYSYRYIRMAPLIMRNFLERF